MRGERGVATLLVALAGLGVAVVAVIFLGAFAAQVNQHRVEGAADLVALTAAQVHNKGTGAACEAAQRAAASDGVRLVSCAVRGPAESFVVTVRVQGGSGSLGWVPVASEAEAHAGVRGLE